MKSIIKEILRIEKQLSDTSLKLSNNNFLLKASKDAVEKEKQKQQDFKASLILLTGQWDNQYKILLNYFKTRERISWHVQYLRECVTELDLYESDWFDYVYNENITLEELEQLYNKIYEFTTKNFG